MAYVPRYLYDIFISYASADHRNSGLVDAFHEKLKNALDAELEKRDPVSIFFDKNEIESGDTISDQVLSAVRSSAVMVVLFSKAYERSEKWCCREYHEFTTDAGDLGGRLHIISLGNKDPRRSNLRDLGARRFRSFFAGEMGDDSLAFDPHQPDRTNAQGRGMTDEVTRLAREIARSLDEMRAEAPVKRVFVASASAAWDRHREDMKNWFRQHQYLVLMQSPWGRDDQALAAQTSRMLENCDAFVGIAEPDAPGDPGWELGQRQLQAASELGTCIRLQWLPDDAQRISEAERQSLVTLEGVRTGSLEGFKSLVRERLGEAIVTSDALHADADEEAAGFLLVAVNHSDEGLISPLLEFARNRSAGHDVWVDGPDETEWKASLKRRIEEDGASGVVFADGNCDRDWIQDRMRGLDTMRRDLPQELKLAYCAFEPIPKAPPRHYRPAKTVEANSANLAPLADLLG